MKFTTTQYTILASTLQEFLTTAGIEALMQYRENLAKNPKIKNIDKAYRWGVLHASGFRIGDGIGIIGDINGDFCDTHIDTALRKFFQHKK